jgi:hypothetical protein
MTTTACLSAINRDSRDRRCARPAVALGRADPRG